MTLPPKNTQEEFDSFGEVKDHENHANAYHYLGSKDKHLVDLIWYSTLLQEIVDSLGYSKIDDETRCELHEINCRFLKEIGFRTQKIFITH